MPTFHYRPMTIQHLYHLLSRNKINTSPSYQREIVWNTKRQQGLIQTLLDRFPMPALNFCLLEDETYECMDGKNRLESIR